MVLRRHLLLLLAGVMASTGAGYRTQNFIVDAPTPEIAQQAGQYAEYYRKAKGIEWLGQEMPPWPDPCPLKIKITMGGAGGATSFNFDQGRVFQYMEVEGSLERILNSVLPHEVTHTVFAYYFRRPVPRWADEGGAVLSEDDIERNRHDQLVRHILNTPGRAIQLRTLFNLREYPRDVMSLYAEGFSVVNFLVAQSNRQQFLGFVSTGMQRGWDAAAQTYYRYRSIEDLEESWLSHLRETRRQPPAQALLAQNAGAPPPGTPVSQVVVRQTVPPAQPFPNGRSVYRGQAGGDGEADDSNRTAPMAMLRPPESWQPAGQPSQPGQPLSGGARLGAPEFSPPPVSPGSGWGASGWSAGTNPPGYPR